MLQVVLAGPIGKSCSNRGPVEKMGSEDGGVPSIAKLTSRGLLGHAGVWQRPLVWAAKPDKTLDDESFGKHQAGCELRFVGIRMLKDQ